MLIRWSGLVLLTVLLFFTRETFAGGVQMAGPKPGCAPGFQCPPGGGYCPPRYGYGYPTYGTGFAGYSGYFVGSSDRTVVINNYYTPPAPVVVSPPQPERAPEVLPPATRNGVAQIEVSLPADADLFFQGVKMKKTGARRSFVTPPLEAGESYTYQVRAVWKENGREVTQSRGLSVHAGDRQSIVLGPESLSLNASARGGR